MKAEILKIAGVKNEKEFYKKYPSEEAFMKTHGKAFKKAAMGASMVKKQLTQLTDFSNPPMAKKGKEVVKLQNAQVSVPGNLLGLNTGTALGANPTGTFDWSTGMGGSLTGATGTPTLSGGNAAGMYQVSDFDRQGIQKDIMSTMNKKQGFDLLGKLGGPVGLANVAGGLIQGIKGIGDEKKALKKARTAEKVSALTLQASRSRPSDPIRRQYTRPEDYVITGSELSPKGFYQGTNTNILAARDGMQIGGNLTEIQNMYNPGDLYSNLGYEPLSESDIVKQYAHGGDVNKAQFGDILGQIAGSSAGGQVTDLFGQIGSGGAPNAGSGLGKTLGSTAGTLVGGPIGGFIGGAIGGLAGGLFDKNARKAKEAQEQTVQNLKTAAFQSGIQGLQSQYGSYMKNGGSMDSDYEWVSHTWQPQVITKFGDMDVSQMHSFATEGMDTLRTGGNITQNNMYPQDQFNFGGQLQTTWGGRAETMSYNPYLPGTGETVMFKGNSHEESDRKGRTGIGVKYGNDGEYSPYMEYGRDGIEDVTDVEVERGEPAVQLPDTGSEGFTGNFDMGGNLNNDLSMNVYGNLEINDDAAEFIGDPRLKGKKMKYKNYIAKVLTPEENKQGVIKQKASDLIELHDDGTPFGNIALQTAQAMLTGADMNYKKIADFKVKAAAKQEGDNKAAEMFGADADSFVKGEFKIDKEAMKQTAKYGKAIEKAQKGKEFPYHPITNPEGYKDRLSFSQDVKDIVAPEAQGWYKLNPKYKGDLSRPWDKEGKANKKIYDEAFAKFKAQKQKGQKPFVPYSLPTAGMTDIYNEALKDFTEQSSNVPVAERKLVKYETPPQKTATPVTKTATAQNTDKPKYKPTPKKITKTVPGKTKMTVKTPGIQEDVDQEIPLVDINLPEEAAPVVDQKKDVQALPTEKKKKFDWLEGLNTVLPYLQRPYEEPFDMSQLYPEMMALATNTLEPVKTQGINVLLEDPYEINRRAAKNDVIAQTRAAQRMAGGDPSALANIAAQSYSALQHLNEQDFIDNQNLKAGVYGRNRAALNQNVRDNLAIFADQEQKQQLAEVNTKNTALAAMQSMSDKMAKQRRENRTLKAYENVFPNYAVTPDMRLIPKGLTLFQNPVVGSTASTTDKTETKKKKSDEETTAKKGKIVKKNNLNSTVVRALKNI